MTTTTSTESGYPPQLRRAIDDLEIALPAPGDELEQDEEWVVVKVDGDWKKIRLHDYGEVYAIPGLYEKWIYDVFGCRSPEKIRELMERCLEAEGVRFEDLTVLDLGAGNGYVADELRRAGAHRFVGVDIYQEAADAAERDRPGLYDEYVVDDLTNLNDENRRTLDRFDFNCLTCVAALGFGDIPPSVFAEAYNRIADGGWIAFTIKTDFLDERDKSGFSVLIRRLMAENRLDLAQRESYVHRISTDGKELRYEAFIGRKRAEIPGDWALD